MTFRLFGSRVGSEIIFVITCSYNVHDKHQQIENARTHRPIIVLTCSRVRNSFNPPDNQVTRNHRDVAAMINGRGGGGGASTTQ